LNCRNWRCDALGDRGATLEGFYSQAFGVRADGDQRQKGVRAGADDGQVVRGFANNEKHGRLRAGVGGGKAHEGRRSADGDGAIENAAVEDVQSNDTRGGAIGDVHFGGVAIDDTGGRSGAEQHGVGYFVSGSVDDLEAVGFGRKDVELAAVGLEKHLRGSAGEFEIAEENGAIKVDDGKTSLRAAHDEGERAVGSNENFIGLRNDLDGVEPLKSARVVD
jgi:hypothetical protein